MGGIAPDNPATAAPYLEPYLRAAKRHGADFPTLLWASPDTQAARFDAIRRLGGLDGKSVLDVGCGRADLLEFLLRRGVRPADYTGIEAVEELAAAAEDNCLRWAGVPARVVRSDFLREPLRLFVAADVVVFSGSLNTIDDGPFYTALRRAYEAAAARLVFNFLCSTYLAGADYLRWRRPEDVMKFARSMSRDVAALSDYLPGDCTVSVNKPRRRP